ncbi:HD-GYP domain-containing protein [Shewanella eurypsychrophilus]|uniref:HD-GYP domain-containing protein n=1 Tax=Shewanella eurypsychrophilus TaxID=2593656 RepID=A0ABX6VCE1_9GAMM|nr:MULTISPECIES: HD-GYP domain-containing protein [Shewanella]QFU24283.1 HD domain-containing protein [Shewanella sp. YLB-09]QPG59484.1 HD-GYP domain-containing protein [Shewanella eurypsychrophilus]
MDKHGLHQLVAAISAAAAARDHYTATHQKNVSCLARRIAQHLALLSTQIECIRISALLHDIGKLGVPSSILSKTGKLRKEEFELIKLHPVIGEEILQQVDFEWPVASIVRQHHERLNGSGYPDGLTGDQIHFESKVIAVADVVESISHSRSYRQALGQQKAIDEISKNRGILYEPIVVDACIALYDLNQGELFPSQQE